MKRLEAALVAADRVFAALPAIGRVEGCGHCYGDDELRALGGPVSEVPDGLVRQFAQEVPDHWEQGQYGVLWRRFAVRIVGMVARDHSSVLVEWMLRGPGAPEAGFDLWPPRHQDVLVDLYVALLDVAVVGWRAGEVVDVLDGMAYLPQGLGFWLSHLESVSGPGAEAGLVRLAAELAAELAEQLASYGKTALPWFRTGPEVGETLERWLMSQPVRDRVAGFAFAHPSCGTAALAVFTIDHLALGPGYAEDLAVDSDHCPACRRQPGDLW